MTEKRSIAGVVVLFNPEEKVIENINSYLDQIDFLFIVDNSEKFNEIIADYFKSNSKVEYVYNGGNLGVAAALNVGVKKATETGFQYLFTLDQDSKATSDLIKNLLECFLFDNNIAIVSPEHYFHKSNNNFKICEKVYTVWTSGNLVDLRILNRVGGYREDFFIDYVDHEICLRLITLGYKIYQCHKSILEHNLGKVTKKKFFNRFVYPTNHSPIRLYYRSRNRFYVNKIYKKQFPEFFKNDRKDFWKSFLKVVLFEKNKLKKIRFFILGYIDYKRNRFGKLNK